MAFDFSTVKNKKNKKEETVGFDFSSVKGRTERTEEEKKQYTSSLLKNKNDITKSTNYSETAKKGRANYESFISGKTDSWLGDRLSKTAAAKVWLPSWDKYSEEEKDMYGYLYETDKDKAREYMLETNKAYEEASREKIKNATVNWAEQNPVAASAASLLTNVFAPADYIRNMGTAQATEFIDGEASIMPSAGYSDIASYMQEGVQRKIERNTNLEFAGANVAAQLYGTGMSIANSAALITTMGPLASIEMAMQAAASATMEAHDRGVTDAQAVKYGTAAGFAEALAEYISIDKLLKIKSPHTVKQAVMSLIKQGAVEASEEAATTIANTITDQIINGNKSEYMLNYANYISEGKSKEDAEIRAFLDWGGELLWDAIGGFVSGGVLAGGANVIQSFARADDGSEKVAEQLGEDKSAVIDFAKQTEEGSDAQKAAEDIETRIEKGETISNKEYAEVLRKARTEFETADIEKQIRAEAMSTGENLSDEEIKSMSTDVLKTMRGDFVSEEANARIEHSEAAKNVYARNTGVDYTYGEQLSEEKTQNLENRRTEQVVAEISEGKSEGYKKTLGEAYSAYNQSGARYKVDAEVFADEFDNFYDIGRQGVESIDKALEAYGKGDQALKNALELAYVLGRGEAVSENAKRIETKQAEINKKLLENKGRSIYSAGAVRLATEAELSRKGVAAVKGKVVTKGKELSKTQKASMQFLREFAKLSGVNIVLYEGGDSRGWYDTRNNEIYYNVEKGMNLKTLAHELTHFIQEQSPEKYEEFKQFILSYYKKNGKYEGLLENAHKRQPDLSKEEFEDEIVANACQMFIFDTEAMQELINTQSKGLIETITRWFKNMCEYLRQAFEGVKASHPAAQALEEDIEMLEQARDKWYELLNESITVNKQIGTNAKNQAQNYDESKQKFEMKDSEGNELSPEQAEFFKNSKVRDENGNLKVMHHGTNSSGFTVFDPGYSDDAISLFFSDNTDVAGSYSKFEDSVRFDPFYEDIKVETVDDFRNLSQRAFEDKNNDILYKNIRIEKVGSKLAEEFNNELDGIKSRFVISCEKLYTYSKELFDRPLDGYELEENVKANLKALENIVNDKYGNREAIFENIAGVMDVLTEAQILSEHFVKKYADKVYSDDMTYLRSLADIIETREKRAWTIYEGMDARMEILKMLEKEANKEKWIWFVEADQHRIYNGTALIGIEPGEDRKMIGSEEDVVKRAMTFGKDKGMFKGGGNRYDVYLNLENPYIYEGGFHFEGVASNLMIETNWNEEYDVYIVTNKFGDKRFAKHCYDYYELEEYITYIVTDREIRDEILTSGEEIEANFRNVPVDLTINDYWNELTGPDGKKTNTRGITRYAKNNGYDGVIFKDIVDNGGQSHYDTADVPSTVAVAFSSEQVKDIDNKAPTKDPDIRFELKDDVDNLVLANYNSIRLPAKEYRRLEHAIKTYHSQKKGLMTHLLDNEEGEPAYLYTVFVDDDYSMKVIGKREGDYYDERREYRNADKEAKGFDWYVGEYKNQRDNGGVSGIGFERKPNGRTGGLPDKKTSDGNRSNGGRGYQSVSGLSEERINELNDIFGKNSVYELKDEDENRLEIIDSQEERLVKDLKTLEKYYGDAIRQVYEQNIKPNEGMSKRAEELNRKAARRFMNEVGAMFQVPKETREEYLLPIINEIIDKGPAISENEGLIDKLYQEAYSHTEDYIVDTDPEGNYKNLRDYIRKTSVFVDAETKADVGDYNNFRKHNMGSLRLTSDQTALGLDEFYEEVTNLAPEIFSGSQDGAEQLYELSAFMKDRGRTESIGDFMPQAEYIAWADETLEPELNKLFDSTIGSFLSEASRKEGERKRAAKVDKAMENVTGAIKNYEAAQDYARAEGFLAGQIEQGKKMSAEMRRKQEEFERKAKNYEDMIAAKRAEIKKVRERRDEILAERRAAFEAYREKRAESIRGGAFRKRIERNAKTLGDWLLKNSDKEHIPETLKNVVGDFLVSIDFSSKRSLAGGAPTKKDKAFADRLLRLSEVLSKQQQYMDNPEKNDVDAFLDLPAGFAEEVTELANKVILASNERGFVVNDMNSMELAELDKMLRVLTTSIRKMNKFITDAHFASITDAAQETMTELSEYAEYKPQNDAVEAAIKILDWDTFTPVYAFKRYGRAGERVFGSIQKGWGEFAFAINDVLEFAKETYTDKEVKEWEKEIHKIELSDGREATFTAAQLMSLYCLNKREQAQGHIYGGGIRIADIKNGKTKVQQSEPYYVTFEDMSKLLGELSDRQIEVANKLQKFMTEVGSEWGNKVSMERFGYRAFTEENYFPITSDPNNLIVVDPEARANDMFRLLNISATKSLTKNANNALIISDIFDVFSNHMSDMAKYGTLALPILDAMKWYNYKVKNDLGDGHFATETVQKSVERAYGQAGKNYFTTFMKDLNGTKEGGRGETLARKMTSNYKVASVGANIRVAVLQPTSIVRATAVIEPKYLLQAIGKMPAGKEAEKHSGIALWKSMGFYNTDVSRGIREQIKGGGGVSEVVREKSMFLAEQMDRVTWGTLWNAAKLKAQDKGYFGEKLLEKTTEIFDEVIYKTQVVDSTLTRNALMRSNSMFISSSTAFMAEPTIAYNMVAETVYEMRKEKDFSAGWKKYGKALEKAVAVYGATALFTALFESIPDALRDDDDDERFGLKFWQAFWGEKILDGNLYSEASIIQKIPFLKDVISAFKGYDNQRMESAWITSAVKAVEIAKEMFDVYVRGEKPTSTTYYGKMTPYGGFYTGLKAFSQLSGLPVANVTRDVVAIWNTIIGSMAPSLKIKTYDDSKKE